MPDRAGYSRVEFPGLDGMTRRALALASAGLLLIGAAVVASRRGQGRGCPSREPSIRWKTWIAFVVHLSSSSAERLSGHRPRGPRSGVTGSAFRERPTRVDEGTLAVGPDSDRDPGIGHMSIYRNAFESWNPRFMQASPVRDAELDGYREWQKYGGVFRNEVAGAQHA